MNWFKGWFSNQEVQEKAEPTLTLENPAAFTSAAMNEQRASKIEAYYSCIGDVSRTIGQLPINLYRKDRDGRRTRLPDGRTHRIFTKRPNDFMRMSDLVRMIGVNLKSNGVFYAYVNRNDRGNVMEIIPFFNQKAITAHNDLNGNIYYMYTYNDNRIGDPYRVEDLLIIKDFTFDGFTPVSPIVRMGTILGIAESQETSYHELQEHGITSQMAFAVDGKFNDEKAIKRLKEQWDSYRGRKGRKNIPILEDGMKPVALKLTPQESDLINHREFSVKRIASALGVPLYRINMNEGTISKGVIPEYDESYMRNTLNPILVSIEEALNEFLPNDLQVEFVRKAFYAGSPWRLVEHVSKEVSAGLAMINEGREDLGRETVEGGDVFAIDSNNATYGTWPELPAVREQINGRAANTGGTQEDEGNAD